MVEPFHHIIDRCFCRCLPQPFPLGVGCVEELGCRCWGSRSAILSNVERLRWYREPGQISDDWEGRSACDHRAVVRPYLPFDAIKLFPLAGNPTITTHILVSSACMPILLAREFCLLLCVVLCCEENLCVSGLDCPSAATRGVTAS